jgi:hypothetical protein
VDFEDYHKPGGTLTCATNSVVGRIRCTVLDPVQNPAVEIEYWGVGIHYQTACSTCAHSTSPYMSKTPPVMTNATA